MHPSAYKNAESFFRTYAPAFRSGHVVELGSRDVNGSIRDLAPTHLQYTGVDFDRGAGVDVVLDDPYRLPFPDDSVDIVVSSSCFEHSAMFWLVFLEILRILKPEGLFYLNVPANGSFHRYPVDCWRFYPDSGGALVEWGRRSGYSVVLLESLVSDRMQSKWNDFVAVFLKDERYFDRHPMRILPTHWGYTNGRIDSDPAGRLRFPSRTIGKKTRPRFKPKKIWKRLKRRLAGRG